MTLVLAFATTLGSTDTSPLPVTVAANNVTHVIDPLFMGCHSDSGFAHTQRNFYSQMIYGESFEFNTSSSWNYKPNRYDTHPTAAEIKWNTFNSPGAKGTVSYDASEQHHGYSSLHIVRSAAKHALDSGVTVVGATNRGIGNEGLF